MGSFAGSYEPEHLDRSIIAAFSPSEDIYVKDPTAFAQKINKMLALNSPPTLLAGRRN